MEKKIYGKYMYMYLPYMHVCVFSSVCFSAEIQLDENIEQTKTSG